MDITTLIFVFFTVFGIYISNDMETKTETKQMDEKLEENRKLTYNVHGKYNKNHL